MSHTKDVTHCRTFFTLPGTKGIGCTDRDYWGSITDAQTYTNGTKSEALYFLAGLKREDVISVCETLDTDNYLRVSVYYWGPPNKKTGRTQ